ncbi:uncharacterized protein LOC128185402 [Crassostrea angulata]|uniref:uncharacterized protein LOC128185402 n=1 Tax=Magallana angulata TaxID=2784310 RepID=UPI0022B1493D|nr:uncharacterized protein LOC128185402 [Crassostrea angulata]
MPRKRQTTGRIATAASSSSRQPPKRVKRSSRTPQTDIQASQPDLHVQASEATQQLAPALQPPLSVEARQQTTSAPQMALNMQATHLPALAPQPAQQMQAYLPPAQPPQPPQQSPQPTTQQFGEGNDFDTCSKLMEMFKQVAQELGVPLAEDKSWQRFRQAAPQAQIKPVPVPSSFQHLISNMR